MSFFKETSNSDWGRNIPLPQNSLLLLQPPVCPSVVPLSPAPENSSSHLLQSWGIVSRSHYINIPTISPVWQNARYAIVICKSPTLILCRHLQRVDFNMLPLGETVWPVGGRRAPLPLSMEKGRESRTSLQERLPMLSVPWAVGYQDVSPSKSSFPWAMWKGQQAVTHLIREMKAFSCIQDIAFCQVLNPCLPYTPALWQKPSPLHSGDGQRWSMQSIWILCTLWQTYGAVNSMANSASLWWQIQDCWSIA